MQTSVAPKNKVDFLNIIRFIAFIIVFSLHAKNFAPQAWNQTRFPWLTYTPAWAGVWIFFILSGYGTGAGFFSGRYEIKDLRDIGKFWWGRFKKIAPMYYLYIGFVMLFVTPTLLVPNKEHLVLIGKLLFFIYDPRVDNYGLGIVWYLCTLIKLYFLAPVIWMFMKRILTTRRRTMLTMILLVAGGLCLRLLARYIMQKTGAGAWHIDVYKPFYFNLDFFAAGFCISRLRGLERRQKGAGWKRWLSFISLIVLILYNNKIYYTASILQRHIESQNLFENYWMIYQDLLPSLYCIIILCIIKFWDIDRDYEYEKFSLKMVWHNPLRVFDKFPAVLMTCYLFHANVLKALSGVIASQYVKTDAFTTHLIQMIAAFLVTLTGALLISRLNHIN